MKKWENPEIEQLNIAETFNFHKNDNVFNSTSGAITPTTKPSDFMRGSGSSGPSGFSGSSGPSGR